MNEKLVPANAKKSMLVAGFLRPLPDLVILGVGLGTTTIILLIIGTSTFVPTLLACIPALIGICLVLPIPNYHNVFTTICVVLKFYINRRIYRWKGWCVSDEFKE